MATITPLILPCGSHDMLKVICSLGDSEHAVINKHPTIAPTNLHVRNGLVLLASCTFAPPVQSLKERMYLTVYFLLKLFLLTHRSNISALFWHRPSIAHSECCSPLTGQYSFAWRLRTGIRGSMLNAFDFRLLAGSLYKVVRC